jgi:hypothetical protein
MGKWLITDHCPGGVNSIFAQVLTLVTQSSVLTLVKRALRGSHLQGLAIWDKKQQKNHNFDAHN